LCARKSRRGKPLNVTPGKAVFFEPFITFKASSGLDAKAPCKSLRRKQIEAGSLLTAATSVKRTPNGRAIAVERIAVMGIQELIQSVTEGGVFRTQTAPVTAPYLNEAVRFPYGPFRFRTQLPKGTNYIVLASTI